MLLVKTYGLQDHTGTGTHLYVTFPPMFANQHEIGLTTKLQCFIRTMKTGTAPDLVFTLSEKGKGELMGEVTLSKQGLRGLQVKIPQKFTERVKLRIEAHELTCHITKNAVHYHRVRKEGYLGD